MPRSIAANFLTFQESEPRVVPESPRLVPSPVNSSVVARRLRQKVYGLRGSASAKGLSAVEAEAEVQGASPEGLVSVHFPMRKRHHGKAVKGRFEKTWRRTQAKLAQRHGKTFEWPDLCISSCIEGLDGAPAFNLAWGASDLTRHHAISRLELQCMPLAAHDVTVAFSDLSWQSLCSAGVGQVLYAIGPPTLFASVEKCVQRFPAHVGHAQAPARVYLTGLAAGHSVALRLRAWQRQEKSWSAFGNVLVIVLPSDNEGAGVEVSQLLSSIRAAERCRIHVLCSANFCAKEHRS